MGQNIGVFDSGLGGLSIYREIKKLLPKQKIIYFADHKNSPYGTKTENEIKKMTISAIKFLELKNCGLVVLACNTATTSGIDFYRRKFPHLKFVGVVPPVKPAAKFSRNKKIAILSTTATAKSLYLKNLIVEFASSCQIFNLGCPELVGAVESGTVNSLETLRELRKYLDKLLREGVDVIVLGCTHFPFLMDPIKNISGKEIKVLEPSKSVARQTLRLYQKTQPKTSKFVPRGDEFYTSGNAGRVSWVASRLLKREIVFKNAD